MAPVPEDEESLLASGRGSETLSRRLGKPARWSRWQGRYRSLFQYRAIGTGVAATLMILTVLVIALWTLCVSHP